MVTDDRISVPTRASVVDISDLIAYVEEVAPLKLAADVMGMERFIDMIIDSVIDIDEEPLCNLRDFVPAKYLDKMLELGGFPEELHYEMWTFKEYQDMNLIKGLPTETVRHYITHGYTIRKWLNKSQVLIETFERALVARSSRAARRYRRAFPEMGLDFGRLRRVPKIGGPELQSADIPY